MDQKGDSGNFDTPIGAFDGAEICELVGCVLLYNIDKILDPYSHGLYRNDGLIIVDKSLPRKCDNIRKRLHWLFDKFGFKLEIQTDLKMLIILILPWTFTIGLYPHLEKKKSESALCWYGI